VFQQRLRKEKGYLRQFEQASLRFLNWKKKCWSFWHFSGVFFLAQFKYSKVVEAQILNLLFYAGVSKIACNGQFARKNPLPS
jgi:hypothetical protein